MDAVSGTKVGSGGAAPKVQAETPAKKPEKTPNRLLDAVASPETAWGADNVVAFYRASVQPTPSAVVGPEAAALGKSTVDDKSREDECKAVVAAPLSLVPLVGQPLADSAGDKFCAPTPRSSIGLLPNVKVSGPPAAPTKPEPPAKGPTVEDLAAPIQPETSK